MTNINFEHLILLALLTSQVLNVQLMLRPYQPVCTVVVASFDPIKLEANFPAIGAKIQGQKFKISLLNTKTQVLQQEHLVDDDRVFRHNFYMENVLYDLCFELITQRQSLPGDGFLYVGYTAEEHFDNMIGKIQIPEELAKEDNLKVIYEVSSQMKQLNKVTNSHQQKERELEDKLVDLSLHKTSRIVSITLIECGVILISGFYQILALRKFLIQRNLY